MVLPDEPGQGWEVEIGVSGGGDAGDCNADVFAVDDGDFSSADAVPQEAQQTHRAVKGPECNAHEDPELIATLMT